MTGPISITVIQIIPDRAAQSSCQVQKVNDGRGKIVSTESGVLLAFRHNLGIATQG